jgi:DNA-binding NarL/FixJ family response regulator
MSTQPTLLLIEDNAGDADLLRLRIAECPGEERSYKIARADRLSTGLAALANEKPAVIVLDLHLPDSRGAETFKHVLNQAHDIPVVVFTSGDNEELILDALRHGAQDYLVKGSFDGKELGHALRCAIERQALETASALIRRERLQAEEVFRSRVIRELRAQLSSIQQFVTALLCDLPKEPLPKPTLSI